MNLLSRNCLRKKECKAVDFGKDPKKLVHEKLYLGRFKLLRKAYERAEVSVNDEFNAFVESQAYWLKDYALFMALKDFFEDTVGLSGRKILSFAGPMLWIIIGRSCILILSFMNIFSSSFVVSGIS